MGYSSLAVASDRVYAMGWHWREGIDTVACLDAVTGKTLWKHTYPAASGVWLDVGRGKVPELNGMKLARHLV
jgi:outer membrane protein assembly factor BamB